MNSWSRFVNRGTIKLFVALSIPCLIAWVFIYSENESNRAMEEYNRERKIHPTAQHISVKDYELKEVDDRNHIRWRLKAESGTLSDDNKEATLIGVQVEYYDGPNVKMRLLAPVGTANEVTKYVKLSASEKQRVTAQGEAGKATLQANTVELTKKNQFVASGGVNIEWPKVAKVTGDTASGRVDLADFKDFKISGNTHALIGLQ